MNADDLYNSFDAVDDDTLLKSETGTKRRMSPARWIAAAAAAVLALGAVAFAVGRITNGSGSARELTAAEIAELEKKEIYPELPGDLAVYYYELSELARDAECIARVRVLGREIEMQFYMSPMTHTTVRLEEVYKGDKHPGETITVHEQGGMSDEHLLGDFPQLSENDEYILFMNYSEEKYYICGAIQGRFIVHDGYVFQQTIENVGLKDYTPMKVRDFVNEVKRLVW